MNATAIPPATWAAFVHQLRREFAAELGQKVLACRLKSLAESAGFAGEADCRWWCEQWRDWLRENGGPP